MKKIPYGIDDFDVIIKDNYYYIDKTRYIKTVEDQNSYILFVRPRRMGKSLFVNMMISYYDIAKKDQFDALFGNLWIGKNKTPLANKFLILKFDFSKVSVTTDRLSVNFSKYCLQQIKDFLFRYKPYFTDEEISETLSETNAKDAINALINLTKRKNLDTYLFIDEYDNFTNMVLSARGVRAHEDITHGEGFYRDFFKACKGSFRRIFMTGVTPVTYDDLTSGFNIADVVALLPQFDKTIGVTEIELREMIEYYRSEGRISDTDMSGNPASIDDIVSVMKPWYDNFCFSERCYDVEPPIYNTDMVMRFLNHLVTSGYIPDEMLDTNARTDYEKLNFLVMAEDLDNRARRIDIVKNICAKGFTIGRVNEQFPASRCGNEENFKSMLYYFGTLTFGGWNEEGETKLQVPNKTMGELYLKYMLQVISQEGFDVDKEHRMLQSYIRDTAVNQSWLELINKLGEVYNSYSSLRNSIHGESDIQGFLRGLLCLNKYYDVWPELELGHGYCDILLVPKSSPRCPTKYSYIIEIKYMKVSDTNVEYFVDQACSQLSRYVTDNHLYSSRLLKGTTLTKLYMVFRGNKLIKFGES